MSSAEQAKSIVPSRWPRILVVTFTAVLALVFYVCPVSRDGGGYKVLIEAEDAMNIRAPIEIHEEPGDEGLSYLRFPLLGRVRPVASVLADKPRVQFEVPVEGSYYVWARTKWEHECANSFLMELDGGQLLMIGNDEDFNRWHWVRHERPLVLAPGAHELVIDAVEPEIEIDQLLITDQANPTLPGEQEAEFLDDFRQGVPTSWKTASKKHWSVEYHEGKGRVFRLAPRRGQDLEYAIRPGSLLANDFYLRVQARSTPGVSDGGDLALIFGYHDADQFRYVRLAANGIILGRMRNGSLEETQIGRPSAELLSALEGKQRWDVELLIEGGKLQVWQQGRLLVGVAWPEPVLGEVGVGSREGGIDLIRFEGRSIGRPSLTHKFYYDTRPFDEVVGFQPVSGSWRRGNVYTAPHTFPLEVRAGKERALTIAGKRWWTRYHLSTALRLHGDAWAGLVFQYRDPDNYTLLQARAGVGVEARGEMRLLRRRGGDEEMLDRIEVSLSRNRWQVLAVDVTDNRISGLVNGRKVVDVAGQETVPGRVGLAAELVSGTGARPERDPAMFLDMDSDESFYVTLPLTFDYDAPGAMLVFHYQDPGNYYRFGVVRDEEADSHRVVLERVSDGGAVPVHTIPLSLRDRGLSLTRTLTVVIDDRDIRTSIGAELFAGVTEHVWREGRVGYQGLMPPSHADFDEVLVRAPGARRDARTYSFNPTRNAARDLAAWDPVLGEWGIGIISDSRQIYSLLGRTGQSGVALLRNRTPLEAALYSLRVPLRPGERPPDQVEIGLSSADPEIVAPVLSVTIEQQSAAGGDAAILLARRGGHEVARTRLGTLWQPLEWHVLELELAEEGAYTVSLDGTKMLTVPGPTQTRGSIVYLSTTGAEGAVCAFAGTPFDFDGVQIETQPTETPSGG